VKKKSFVLYGNETEYKYGLLLVLMEVLLMPSLQEVGIIRRLKYDTLHLRFDDLVLVDACSIRKRVIMFPDLKDLKNSDDFSFKQ
jgi:hypothetical protein